MRGDVRNWIQSAGLGRVVDKLEALLRPSIRIRIRKSDENAIEIGASKIGGVPDLPQGFEWPRWAGRLQNRESTTPKPTPAPIDNEHRHSGQDGPMFFWGQFRMADVAPHDAEGILPTTGMLYVYCALWVDALGCAEDDRGARRVIYREVAPSDLRRTSPPDDASPPLECESVAFFKELTLPDNKMFPEYDALVLSPEEHERYRDFLMDQMQAHPWQDRPTHRLLGWPQAAQPEMCNGLYPSGHRDWRLLLQIHSVHYYLNPFWQAGGRGFFWIREPDLRARNFDGAWLVIESAARMAR
jgi:uncharacterized protein YwqG